MPLASIGFDAAATVNSVNINAKMRRNEVVNFIIEESTVVCGESRLDGFVW
jgi:hypothetical protein